MEGCRSTTRASRRTAGAMIPPATSRTCDRYRAGIYCYEKRDLQVRSMRLTGDWPDVVPAALMVK